MSTDSFRSWRMKTRHRFHCWVADSKFYDWLSSPRVRGLHSRWPSLPRWLATRLGTRGFSTPRSLVVPEIPEELKTYAGIPRNRALEEKSFREDGPLPLWTNVHADAMRCLRQGQWLLDIFTIPRRNRELQKVQRVKRTKPNPKRSELEPAALTEAVRKRAAEIGLSAIGITKRDPLVTFAPFVDVKPEGDTVIVCIAEQNYGATQTIPSFRAELAHYDTYMKEFPAELAAYLRELGYVANVYGEHGMNIAYAVEAGLGQLGLNGQLLTPFAGPRLRLHMILTDAPLVHDQPVDYGVPAICDRCKSCVRNCPSGAIRSTRDWYRGVYKPKIKTERCIPIVVQAHGCGVCMKVCPVQKYGLPAVIDEYKRSGAILGLNTDELEGYDWPFDGQHYGPSEKPPVAQINKLLEGPPGFFFDPKQKQRKESGVPGGVMESGGVVVAVETKKVDAEIEEKLPVM